MPLIKSKSKKAVSKNIETEMDAGKPKDQSIAIALNVQRKAKAKKMASGGMVPIMKEHPASIADAIMQKRKRMMSDGGMILPDDELMDPIDQELPRETHDSDELLMADQDQEGPNMPHEEEYDEDMISKVRSRMKRRV